MRMKEDGLAKSICYADLQNAEPLDDERREHARDWARKHKRTSIEFYRDGQLVASEQLPRKYKASFTGRRRGAIGVTGHYSHEVVAVNLEGARLALYEHFDHISGATFEEIE